MIRVTFTRNIQRHVECPDCSCAGATVREALEHVFARVPLARGYLLDDQGGLRKHIVIFVDGHAIRDRAKLGDPVAPDGAIHVFQSLSGG